MGASIPFAQTCLPASHEKSICLFARSPSCHTKLNWSPGCDSDDDDMIEILSGEASESDRDSDIECITKEVSRRLSIEDTSSMHSISTSVEQRLKRTVTYDSDARSNTMSDGDSVDEQIQAQHHVTVSCAVKPTVQATKRMSFPPKCYLSDSSDDSDNEWLFSTKNKPQKSDTKIASTVQSMKPSAVHVVNLDQDDSSDSDISISQGFSSAVQRVHDEVVDLCSP